MGVLHHIADPRPMLDEMHRVLRPGGEVIVMMYHRYSWKQMVVHSAEAPGRPALSRQDARAKSST